MLELTDVHVHYGLSHVLQGVAFSVGRGEVVGVFGRNGVGKTTVIKTVAGWLQPSSGTVRFAGERISGLRPERICRLGIGLVPEDRRIFPGLTVDENLRLGLLQAPVRAKRASAARLDAVYGRFPGLAERRRQHGRTLSGGEQQMLAIARVLIGEPRLLLIDEPTEGLAPMVVEEIFALIEQLRDEGIAILLVEQHVRRALAVCARAYVMARGQVVFEASTAPAEREALLARLSV
ncbi:MAG: ABC transporter ATP-binding protein [Casimicrobiaceae bacterium]